MSNFTIPDPANTLGQLTPQVWRRRAAGIAAVALNARWWLGDFLLAAYTTDREAWATFLNSDPRFCSRDAAAAQSLAAAFPAPTRRLLPESYHLAVADIAAANPPAAAALLDRAESEAMSVQEIEAAAAAWRTGASAAPTAGGLFALAAPND